MAFWCWLYGIVTVGGGICGLISFGLLCWLYWPSQKRTENRCTICRDVHSCEAAHTGVAYPCKHFVKKHSCNTCKIRPTCASAFGGFLPDNCAYWEEKKL